MYQKMSPDEIYKKYEQLGYTNIDLSRSYSIPCQRIGLKNIGLKTTGCITFKNRYFNFNLIKYDNSQFNVSISVDHIKRILVPRREVCHGAFFLIILFDEIGYSMIYDKIRENFLHYLPRIPSITYVFQS